MLRGLPQNRIPTPYVQIYDLIGAWKQQLYLIRTNVAASRLSVTKSRAVIKKNLTKIKVSLTPSTPIEESRISA